MWSLLHAKCLVMNAFITIRFCSAFELYSFIVKAVFLLHKCRNIFTCVLHFVSSFWDKICSWFAFWCLGEKSREKCQKYGNSQGITWDVGHINLLNTSAVPCAVELKSLFKGHVSESRALSCIYFHFWLTDHRSWEHYAIFIMSQFFV